MTHIYAGRALIATTGRAGGSGAGVSPEAYRYDLATPFLVQAIASVINGINLVAANEQNLADAFSLEGANAAEGLSRVQQIGDFDGDGAPDFMISGNRNAYVFLGPLEVDGLHEALDRADFIFDRASLGRPAERVGDLNGDGYSDLAFLQPGASSEIIVIFGKQVLPRFVSANNIANLTTWTEDLTQIYDLNSSDYIWRESDPANMTLQEWYLTTPSGGAPNLNPDILYLNGVAVLPEQVQLPGSLAAGTWRFGNNPIDGETFSTIYLRLADDSDPNALNMAMTGPRTVITAGIIADNDTGIHVLNWDGDRNTEPNTGGFMEDLLVFNGRDSGASRALLYSGAAITGEITGSGMARPSLTITSTDNVLPQLPLMTFRVVGDVNGDGLEDFIIANPLDASSVPGVEPLIGRAFLILGRVGGPASLGLTETDAAAILEDVSLGAGVFALGDLNRDGYDDFAISRSREDLTGAQGGLLIFFGVADYDSGGWTNPDAFSASQLASRRRSSVGRPAIGRRRFRRQPGLECDGRGLQRRRRHGSGCRLPRTHRDRQRLADAQRHRDPGRHRRRFRPCLLWPQRRRARRRRFGSRRRPGSGLCPRTGRPRSPSGGRLRSLRETAVESQSGSERRSDR